MQAWVVFEIQKRFTNLFVLETAKSIVTPRKMILGKGGATKSDEFLEERLPLYTCRSCHNNFLPVDDVLDGYITGKR